MHLRLEDVLASCAYLAATMPQEATALQAVVGGSNIVLDMLTPTDAEGALGPTRHSRDGRRHRKAGN